MELWKVHSVMNFPSEFSEPQGVRDAASAEDDLGSIVVLVRSKGTSWINRPGQGPATLEAIITNFNPSHSW